jgi:DNA-binding LytR/AlgR family response regulator
MQNYKCLIVEDEPLAAEVLQDYISQVPFLEIKGICTDALFALDCLQKENIDLIFLDIHLPKLKGLDFLKILKNPPKVILTTAYHEYALQGYEFGVLDYLLKPIEFGRFLQAVNKLSQTNPAKSTEKEELIAPTERVFHFFNVDKKKIKVYEDDILYIESLKEYVRIFTKYQTLITKFQLGQIEEILNKTNFVRTHRSFLVAKDKIEAYTATHVEIANKEIPIGRNYKELVMNIIGNRI